MRRAILAGLLGVAATFAAGTQFVGVRRTLAAQRAAIDTEWYQLSSAFDERAGAIANFAELVRASAGPDDRVFQDADAADTALRQANAPQAKIEAYSRLMSAFTRLHAVAEKHPKLTESAAYRRLNEEIGSAESEVAVDRRKYNDLLEHYNAQLQTFPYNMVAGLSGFTRIDAYVRTEQEVR